MYLCIYTMTLEMETNFDFDMAQRQIKANLYTTDLSDYKGEMYEEVNRYLNKGGDVSEGSEGSEGSEESEEIRGIVLRLDELIERAPRSNRTMFLYRGIQDWELEYTFFAPQERQRVSVYDWYKHNLNNCLLLRGYTSTSYTFKNASHFSDGIILKFIIPPNFPVLAIDHIVHSHLKSRHLRTPHWEEEVLLPRGIFYYVRSLKRIKISGSNQSFMVITMDPSLCKQIT
jgi:hypothetical protein